MALCTGLGQAATVAQLLGADVSGLISMIMQAALTARQNRKECEQLARRVFMIAELLPHLQLQEPEAVRPLGGLDDTLRDAHELVVSCQRRSAVYQLVTAGRQAERFREVQSKIDFYLILFPVISHIGVTRRLDRIYNALVQDDSASARVKPSPISDLAQQVLPHGTQEFMFAEIVAATNNFALDCSGGYGYMHRGMLHDGREVAVKRINDLHIFSLEEFHKELEILSRLQHDNIIHLLGWCHWSVIKEHTRLLIWRRKEREAKTLIVYEYMENGSLLEHLHFDHSSSLSPVKVSWKVRIDVLLGLSRAIGHLHCHADPPIIHRDIQSSNILLDASWVPRLSDFGGSVEYLNMESEKSGLKCDDVRGTLGYTDPEYFRSGHVKPTTDLYALGVVMLEVLTGKRAFFRDKWDMQNFENEHTCTLPSLALPIIEAGNLGELLDKRPVPEPTPGQLRALELVAQTAVRCVQMELKDRPAISDIVANLELALELICRDEPASS